MNYAFQKGDILQTKFQNQWMKYLTIYTEDMYLHALRMVSEKPSIYRIVDSTQQTIKSHEKSE